MALAMGVRQQMFTVTEDEVFNAKEKCSICFEVVEDPFQTSSRHVICETTSNHKLYLKENGSQYTETYLYSRI